MTVMMSVDELWPYENQRLTLEDMVRLNRPLTVDDLQRLDVANDGRRYELVNGRLEVSPSAFFRHSDVAGRLIAYLTILAPQGFRIGPEVGINLDASLTHHRVVDIGVLELGDYPDKHVNEPLSLAIEILSASTAIKDHNSKREEYARFGIRSYWIVSPDPDDPSITEYRLDDGGYQEVTRVAGKERLETETPFPITIVPYWLVADEDDWLRRLGGAEAPGTGG